MVALVSSSPESMLSENESLMQAILFWFANLKYLIVWFHIKCFSQLDVVVGILKNLLTISIERQSSIVCEQIEGNRNIFHVFFI
jgi:hypothetical protein